MLFWLVACQLSPKPSQGGWHHPRALIEKEIHDIFLNQNVQTVSPIIVLTPIASRSFNDDSWTWRDSDVTVMRQFFISPINCWRLKEKLCFSLRHVRVWLIITRRQKLSMASPNSNTSYDIFSAYKQVPNVLRRSLLVLFIYSPNCLLMFKKKHRKVLFVRQIHLQNFPVPRSLQSAESKSRSDFLFRSADWCMGGLAVL